MSTRQFDEFRASSLYCARCGTAQPVRQKLLLVLPEKELHEYLCTVCGDAVGTKEVSAADQVAAQLAQRRGGRQVRIL